MGRLLLLSSEGMLQGIREATKRREILNEREETVVAMFERETAIAATQKVTHAILQPTISEYSSCGRCSTSI